MSKFSILSFELYLELHSKAIGRGVLKDWLRVRSLSKRRWMRRTLLFPIQSALSIITIGKNTDYIHIDREGMD